MEISNEEVWIILAWLPYKTFIPLHRLLICSSQRLHQRPAKGRDQHALWNPKSQQKQQPLQRRRQELVPLRLKRLKMKIVHATLLHGMVASCQLAHPKSQIQRKYALSYCIYFYCNWSLQKGNMKQSPIYLFYEIVVNGPDGTPGDDRDIHYHCLHGAHKICIIKWSMRSNLNGMAFYVAYRNCNLWFLTNPLLSSGEHHIKSMYQLYCILKNHEELPTPDEITIASGKRKLDGHTKAEYLKKKTWKSIRKHQESIGRSKSVGHHKWRLFTQPLGAYGLIDRDCGTRKCSSSSLLNGLLHATSHLMRWKNLSLLCWWTSHIIQVVNWRFHNVMPLSCVWWRWARK